MKEVNKSEEKASKKLDDELYIRKNDTRCDEVGKGGVVVTVDRILEVDGDVSHFRVVVARRQEILETISFKIKKAFMKKVTIYFNSNQ